MKVENNPRNHKKVIIEEESPFSMNKEFEIFMKKVFRFHFFFALFKFQDVLTFATRGTGFDSYVHLFVGLSSLPLARGNSEKIFSTENVAKRVKLSV